jgi:hypothetical protein
MVSYDNLKIWKEEVADDLMSMQLDPLHGQIQSTAIQLWWNHAVILLLSTECEFDNVVEAVARDSIMRIFEGMDPVKHFFRYEEYLMDWPFQKTPLLNLIGLI